MARRTNEMSAPRAALRLEVDEETIRRWVRNALSVEDGTTRFDKHEVRRDIVGRYWIQRDAVQRLRVQ